MELKELFGRRNTDKAQGDEKDEGKDIIQLQESQERLRPAECAAKGGRYENGQCVK